jgi:hypothetical protein
MGGCETHGREVLEVTEWIREGMLEWRYLGGSWEIWRCRLCGASTDRHFDENINEYIVHSDPEAAERCMSRWARGRRPRR